MSVTRIENGSITSPRGFVAGAAATGMKRGGAYDVALLVSERDCTAAGVFTRSQVVAAPVIVDRATLRANPTGIRGVVMNAKNANACTGEPGIEAARLMQQQAAALLGAEPEQFFVLSTGVIGVQLPLERIGIGIEISALNLSPNGGSIAAQAIMTTDTRPKQVAVRVTLADAEVTIGGIAKGSGMIHPDMATMLAIITTDAQFDDPAEFQALLNRAVNLSFNRISVDGDTSTNDTVLLLANAAGGVRPNAADGTLEPFVAGLTQVCVELAQAIVRDGEGATRFVEIVVEGAADETAAHQVANTIATSPLVKTAFAGGDANWGRILAAAGRAGVPFDQAQAALWFSADGADWLQVLASGQPTDYQEPDAAAIFAAADIWVRLRIGDGGGSATVWTCDLTHEYVSINADYRT